MDIYKAIDTYASIIPIRIRAKALFIVSILYILSHFINGFRIQRTGNKINKMAIENKKLSNENTYLSVDYSAMLSRNSITAKAQEKLNMIRSRHEDNIFFIIDK